MSIRCLGSPANPRFRFVFACLVALAIASCEEPQEPAPPAASGIPGHYDASAQSFTFGIESTPGELSALRLVGREVRFDSETQSVHALVSLRNDGTVALAGPERLVVSGFVPATVEPVNAEACGVSDPAGGTANGLSCIYVHAGTYGEDGMLAPGEESTPIEWVLHDPTGESFAFRVRLRSPSSSAIAGIVFEDLNGNGVRDRDDPVRVDVQVSLQDDAGVRTARTDAAGLFAFSVQRPGLYRIDKVAEPGWRVTTPHPYEVLIVQRPDGTLSGFGRAHFGCQREGFPADIPVVGLVFDDMNRNGQYDAGEPGIPGVEIYGATVQCPTFAPISTITGRDGRYVLRLPGCEPPYEVSRVEVPGFVGTTPSLVVFKEPPVAGVALRADFGMAATDLTCIESPAMLIEALARAYGHRDLAGFRDLLANAPEANAEFVFVLPAPNDLGETAWGFAEEARIHQRMFEPYSPPAGEPPVPPELWVRSLAVTLFPQQVFTERPDLYQPNGGPLDPTRWRAMGAVYGTGVFWDLAGDVDYRVEGGASFVVIEDLTKRGCEAGRFKILVWEDLGSPSDPATAVAPTTWADVKSLYR